jgi:hypothetical protein
LEESSFVKTKGVVATCADIPSISVAMDFDICAAALSKVKARLLVTPLLIFHCASPWLARCAE